MVWCGIESVEERNYYTRYYEVAAVFSKEQTVQKVLSIIAVIRDDLRRFQDETYSSLVQQFMVWSQPKQEGAGSQGGSDTNISSTDDAKEDNGPVPETVQAKQIIVDFNQPWLATESDVDDYIEHYKDELLFIIFLLWC